RPLDHRRGDARRTTNRDERHARACPADTDRPDQPGAWCAPGCLNALINPGPLYRGLYVLINGERVLSGREQPTVELPYTTAGVRLDLYATDVEPSVFTPGQRFRVTARIAPEPLGGAATEALPKYNVSTPWLTLPGG
ncbi:MAG: hypothetical protein ACXVZO_10790, partial [Gaiellaceae bacterium]